MDHPAPIRQIVYVSSATVPMDEAALLGLLAQARACNAAHGVTGMLLYCDEVFMQVIEGEPHTVGDLYARIGRDPRHARVIEVQDLTVAARSFDDWSMGFRHLAADELGQLPGFADFLDHGSPLHERLAGSPDAAHRLLAAFRACSGVVPTLDASNPPG